MYISASPSLKGIWVAYLWVYHSEYVYREPIFYIHTVLYLRFLVFIVIHLTKSVGDYYISTQIKQIR